MNFKCLIGLACAATLMFAVPTFAAAQIDILQVGLVEPSTSVCSLPIDLVGIPTTNSSQSYACVIAETGVAPFLPVASGERLTAVGPFILSPIQTGPLTRPSPPG